MLRYGTDGNGNQRYIDQVQDAGNTDYIKDGQIVRNATSKAVMVTGQSDLASLEGYTPGTIAYTAGFKALWQMDASGQWISL